MLVVPAEREKCIQRALCTSANCCNTEITAFAKSKDVSCVRQETKY